MVLKFLTFVFLMALSETCLCMAMRRMGSRTTFMVCLISISFDCQLRLKPLGSSASSCQVQNNRQGRTWNIDIAGEGHPRSPSTFDTRQFAESPTFRRRLTVSSGIPSRTRGPRFSTKTLSSNSLKIFSSISLTTPLAVLLSSVV